ncbi:MAG: hypothetical protein GY758_09995 [Fuerstiella sp.]|jgi:hypothetical protein|nr:hypothetical protein [Fuerstiella sp.]MCP4507166.1 hypothetical protein [Fuerstiella sp.]MDG2131093.1 hypothetical protein [Fuerstiella sp.]
MTRTSELPPRTGGRILFGLCVAVSLYGYASGWDSWLLLLLLFGVPVRRFCSWMYTGRLNRYRFLFGIYMVAGVIGAFEAWQYGKTSEFLLRAVDLPVGPGAPDLFLEYDLPGVLFELYPERSEVLFIRGFQMKLCHDDLLSMEQHSVCRQFRNADLNAVRECFETALALNSRTDENLYYHYVEILMRQGASQGEVDAAAERWRRVFPLSERSDPRQVFVQDAPTDAGA